MLDLLYQSGNAAIQGEEGTDQLHCGTALAGCQPEHCPNLVGLRPVIAAPPSRSCHSDVLSSDSGRVPPMVRADVQAGFEPMIATPNRNATCRQGQPFVALKRHCVVPTRTSIRTSTVPAGAPSSTSPHRRAPQRFHRLRHAPRGPAMTVVVPSLLQHHDSPPRRDRHCTPDACCAYLSVHTSDFRLDHSCRR